MVTIELASNDAADLALVMKCVGHNQILHYQCLVMSDFLSALSSRPMVTSGQKLGLMRLV